MNLDINYAPVLSVSGSRIALAAGSPDGTIGQFIFLVDPYPPDPNLPYRGLYDAPVGYRLGIVGASLTVPSLSNDEKTVVYSAVQAGGEHLWIITSAKPISPYGT